MAGITRMPGEDDLAFARRRIEAKTVRVPPPEGYGLAEPCWIWTAGVGGTGYGSIRHAGKKARAHRVAYLALVGPIPEGEGYHGTVVMHLCDRPLCCQPAHLRPATQACNVADRVAKGRDARGEDCSWAKLSEPQVIAIRTRYAAGSVSQRALAAEFCVAPAAIGFIVRGEMWAHVGGPRTITRPAGSSRF